MELINVSIKLALLVIAGFAAVKLKVVDRAFRNSLSNLITSILLPCLIIDSLNVEFSSSELLNCGVILLISLLTLVLLFIIGHIFFLLRGRSSFGRVIRYGTVFPNYTFIGIPVIEALFGAHGVFYFTVFTVPVRLLYYSSPQVLVAGRFEHENTAQLLKNIFSPPLIAVFVGIILYVTQLRLPVFLSSTIAALSSSTSTLGMLFCGMILAEADFKNMFRHPSVFLLTLIKNFIAPAVCLAALMFLPVDGLIIKIAVMYAAMPVATLLSTFVLRYSGSEENAANSAANTFLSTALSIVTLPLWAEIVNRVLG